MLSDVTVTLYKWNLNPLGYVDRSTVESILFGSEAVTDVHFRG